MNKKGIQVFERFRMGKTMSELIWFKFKELLHQPGSLRTVGRQIREKIENSWQSYDIVKLDFENETVASGSLFDEIAKLFLKYPKEDVKRRLKFKNIDIWDEHLIVHLVNLRLEKPQEIESEWAF